MRGWTVVMSCADANMAPIIQSGLESAGIPVVILNRQDSSYVGMAFASRPVEICVPDDHAEAAHQWLQSFEE